MVHKCKEVLHTNILKYKSEHPKEALIPRGIITYKLPKSIKAIKI